MDVFSLYSKVQQSTLRALTEEPKESSKQHRYLETKHAGTNLEVMEQTTVIFVNKIFQVHSQLDLKVGRTQVYFLSAPTVKLAIHLLAAGNLCHLLII